MGGLVASLAGSFPKESAAFAMNTVEQEMDLDIQPEAAMPSGSLAERLVSMREEAASAHEATLDLDVPQYNERLLVRFHYPEVGYDPLVKAVERAQAAKVKDAALWANASVIQTACLSVLGRDENGVVVDLRTNRPVLEHEAPEEPLRFDRTLAALLRIDVPEDVKPTRHIMRHVFSPRAHATGVFDGDLALMRTGGKLINWLSGEERDIVEEFSGE